MLVNFDCIFSSIENEELRRQQALNMMIANERIRNGHNCHNCQYARYVQENPYWDYTECLKTGRKIENNEHPICEQYEFVDWGSIK